MAKKPQRLPMPANSLVDASFEFPTVPFVLELDRQIDRTDIVRLARSNFKDVVELKSRLVRPKVGYPYWQEQVNFDYGQVVFEKTLREASYGNLCKEIAEINVEAIDKYKKVAWDIHLLQPPNGFDAGSSDVKGTVLLVRIDHSLTDGRGGLQIIELLAGRPPKTDLQTTGQKQQAKSMFTRKSVQSLLGAAANQHPDPISPIKSEHTSYDVGCAWIPQRWSIAEMKSTLKHTTSHSTINDMIMAIVCGAVQKYLEAKGFDLSQTQIHNSAMVDLFSKFVEPKLHPRPILHDEHGAALINPVFGNGVGVIIYPMPTRAKNAHARLQEITKIMQLERDSDYSSARLAGKLLDKIGLLPRPLLRTIVINGGKSISTYVSNLNFNLADDLVVAGAKVVHARFCGTPNGTLAIYFPVMSFREHLYVNIGYHRDMFAAEDVAMMMRLLQDEYDELVRGQPGSTLGLPN